MKFTCEKSVLLESLNKCISVVSQKSTIPALEGFLFDVEDDITITGYNMEIAVVANFEAAIEIPGKLVINARLFYDIIRRLSSNEITLSLEGYKLSITCANANFEITSLPAEDYPDLPTVLSNSEDVKVLRLKSNQFKDILSKTTHAIGVDPSKNSFYGLLFDVYGNILKLVAVDGFRFAVAEENIINENNVQNFKFIIPPATVKEIDRILNETEEPVILEITKNHIIIAIDNVKIISKLVNKDFFAYENVLSKIGNNEIVINRKDLADAIDRVSLLITERYKSAVRLIFEDNILHISTETAIGKGYDSCYIKNSSTELIEIGFNNKYLADAVNAASDEEIIIDIKNGTSQIYIKPKENNNYLFVVMPVRLN